MSATVLVSGPAPPPELRHGLAAAGFAVRDHRLGSAPAVHFTDVAVALIDVGRQAAAAAAQTRRWRAELRDELVPIIWLLPDADPALAARGLDAGADVVVARPLDEGVLVAQVRAAARLRMAGTRLAAQAAESRLLGDQLRKAYAQIDRELSEARRVHRAFLPHTLPAVGAARFAVSHRPRARVAGDFYDARRLDEHRVGFYVADVIGPGAGSLLGVFVGQSVGMKGITRGGYRVVPPGEVLAAANRELIALGLEERPLVGMLAGTLDGGTGELAVARAGLPAPVYVPADGEPEVWAIPGPFLGTAETTYPARAATLRPGDKLVVATDGTRPEGNPGPDGDDRSLLEAVARHRGLGGQAFVDAVARDLLTGVRHEDDVTLLCVEMGNPVVAE
jgi:serine phosphatase RsbU (regulator of sigma subunit)